MGITIDGRNLSIEEVVRVARGLEDVKLADDCYEPMKRARAVVEDCVRRGKPVYGVNTGFGKFSSVRIADDDVRRLQHNLIVSCCTGVGDPFPTEVVRAMLLLRAARSPSDGLVCDPSWWRPLLTC